MAVASSFDGPLQCDTRFVAVIRSKVVITVGKAKPQGKQIGSSASITVSANGKCRVTTEIDHCGACTRGIHLGIAKR
jgi:hypothetical protein